MTPSPSFLQILAAIGYLVSSVCYGAGTVRTTDTPRRDLLSTGLIAAIIGVLLHTLAIGAKCAQTHHTPFIDSPDSISAVGWACAIVFLSLQLCPVRDRMIALGAFAMPVACLCVITGSILRLNQPAHFYATTSNSRLLDSSLVSLHVLAIVFAFGFLALAVGCALLYLVQDRLLKRKIVSQLLFWRMPSLTTIDNLAFTLVSLAFPLLTIGLAAGIIRAVTEGRAFAVWSVEPQTLASVVTWLIYGAYLWLHAGLSWRGPRANSLLIAGLAAALVTFVMPGTLHKFV
jgi:ABC-type uncharacterized transport system permease subunit